MFFLKLTIVILIVGQVYDAIPYFITLFPIKSFRLDIIFFFIKQTIFILIIYFLYYRIKNFQKKGPIKKRLLIFIIFIYLISWLNGAILGFFYWDGPYRGCVVDADTGEPIARANVMGVWQFEIGAIATTIYSYADARETITDEKGRFFLPVARRVGLWPLSLIVLDELNVYKPGYDSHPPRMQRAWTDEDKEKWRLKLNKLFPEREPGYNPISDTEYLNDLRYVPGRYASRYRVKCKINKQILIRLNRASSSNEQSEAVAVPLGDINDCERYKVNKMVEAINMSKGKLY